MTMQEILKDCYEEKWDNPATTSVKFKEDLYTFFNTDEFKNTSVLEFGTHKGQTTRVLSFLFRNVYTINLPDNFNEAKVNNSDRDNITYIGLDLKSNIAIIPEIKTPLTVAFIDAIHTTKNVLLDIERFLLHPTSDTVYLVFDDYGASPEVRAAVWDFIEGQFFKNVTKYIGHPPMTQITKSIILNDYEGVIVKYEIAQSRLDI